MKGFHGTNSNTVLVIQRRKRLGELGTEKKKSAKSVLIALQKQSICQISTAKYGSGHFDPFKIARKLVKSEDVLRILKLYFSLFKKRKK